jgi:hypothetical protein
MLIVFCRRLALPLWATGCIAFALLISPPATPVVVAILGVASVALLVSGLLQDGRTSPALVPVVSQGLRRRARTVTSMARGSCVRRLDAAQDALDLGRLDDDGGWQKEWCA